MMTANIMQLTDPVRQERAPGMEPWGHPDMIYGQFSSVHLEEIVEALDGAEFRTTKIVKFDEETRTRSYVDADPTTAGMYSANGFWGKAVEDAVSPVREWIKTYIEHRTEHRVVADRTFARKVPVNGHMQPMHADNSNVYPDQATGEMVSDRVYDGEDFSGVLWLGEADGGDVEFPQHGLDFHPRHGMLCVFPSGPDYLHSGAGITAGKRYIVEFRFRLTGEVL